MESGGGRRWPVSAEAPDSVPVTHQEGVQGETQGLTCSCWVPFGSRHARALVALEVAVGIEGCFCALAAAITLVLLVVGVVD